MQISYLITHNIIRNSITTLSSDINECEENICHQFCTNTNGSFNCSCRPEFELQPDGITCNGIWSTIKWLWVNQ